MLKNSTSFLSVFAVAVALSACGGTSTKKDAAVDDDFAVTVSTDGAIEPTDGGSHGDSAVVELPDLLPVGDAAAPAIVAEANTWTWVPISEAVCNDGSQTGIGVNVGTETDKIMWYFEGGGACGSYETCYEYMTATLGPFGESEFTTRAQSFGGSYMDRTVAGNPFATWTYIYVPYCTGDLHGGITAQTYTSGSASSVFLHLGHINVLRDLDRVANTWPTLSEVVVSGSSAGGYGALINYGDVRSRWSSATSYLIDDSGPPLEQTSSSAVLAPWIANWHLINWYQGGCPECVSDFSLALPNLATRFASDRLSLLESLQDMTISSYYLLSATDFQTDLLQMATDRLDPTANFKYFFIPGNTHTMLGNVLSTTYTSNTEQLNTFVTNMVTNSTSWASTKPAP